MRDHELPDNVSAKSAERRADLIAAAHVARTWVYERREAWSDLPHGVVSPRVLPASPVATRATAPVPAAKPARAPAPIHVVPEPPAPIPAAPAMYESAPQAVPIAPVSSEASPSREPVDPATYEAGWPVPLVSEAAARAPAPAPIERMAVPQALPAPAAQYYEAEPEVITSPPLLARAKLRLDLGLAKRARALGQSLGRWSLRLSVAAAIVVALGGAVLTARAYWLKLAAMPKTGTAVLESVPPGSEVLVDGAAVGSTPLTTQLKPGRHVVEFRRRKATRTLEINVAAGQSVVGHLDWTAKRTGDLQVQSDPPGAKVLIDGKERGVTPLTVGDLAVGSHAVVLESASGTVRRTVDVTADATAEVNESIFSGWLHISSPIEVEISEGARQVHPDEKNLVLLGPGSHTLRFENKSLGYHDTRQVAIKAGQTVSILIDPPPSTLSVTATSAAEVLVDGERVGETPLTDHPIKLGTRDITVRSESSGERKFTITVGTKAARVDVDFAKP